MSTSHLYHAYAVRNFNYQATVREGNREIFVVAREPGKLRCASCGSRDVAAFPFRARDILIGRAPQRHLYVRVKLSRLACGCCRAYLQEPLDDLIPHPKARVSRALARTIIELRREMSIKAVAKYFGLPWHTVKNLEKAYLARKYRKIRLADVKFLCIDEIHVGDAGYKTIARDYDSGAVLFVGNGKSGDTLAPFSKRLKQAKADIRAISIDMSNAFTAWVKDEFKNADIIYDHFHVVKLMNKKIDDIRRSIMRKADDDEKAALKGNRQVFLSNRNNLKEGQKQILDALAKQLPDLGVAVYMRERLQTIYAEAVGELDAGMALLDWCEMAKASKIHQLTAMAKTIDTHFHGILGYWRYAGASNARQEGFNNKIRWLISMAYGYRDDEYFNLKIYDLPTVNIRKEL
jgi:transposase